MGMYVSGPILAKIRTPLIGGNLENSLVCVCVCFCLFVCLFVCLCVCLLAKLPNLENLQALLASDDEANIVRRQNSRVTTSGLPVGCIGGRHSELHVHDMAPYHWDTRSDCSCPQLPIPHILVTTARAHTLSPYLDSGHPGYTSTWLRRCSCIAAQ